MDRYFYIVEMDGDRKVVHISGNVYFNDNDDTDTCFRLAEWTWLYMDIEELKERLKDEHNFFDYLCQKVAYLEDLTEEQAIKTCQEYFGGEPGKWLNIKHVNENTPCGDYWFE
jgi:hypothetical protein